jgi:hypothetical protein
MFTLKYAPLNALSELTTIKPTFHLKISSPLSCSYHQYFKSKWHQEGLHTSMFTHFSFSKPLYSVISRCFAARFVSFLLVMLAVWFCRLSCGKDWYFVRIEVRGRPRYRSAVYALEDLSRLQRNDSREGWSRQEAGMSETGEVE